MKISIITCCWNSIAYIAECVRSVQAQTYPNFEHIFVDGGSEDGTLDFLGGVGGNVKVVTGVRGGISAAMNEGIDLASGEIVAHLHSDDYYYSPDVLTRVAEAFQAGACDWLYGRIASDLAGRIVYPDFVMPHYSRPRLIRRNFIPHPATFCSRRLFKEVGYFNTGLKYAMDYDMWLRMSAISTPFYIPEFLTVFRRHGGSASTANKLAVLEEDYAVRRSYITESKITQIECAIRHLHRKRKLHRELRAATPL